MFPLAPPISAGAPSTWPNLKFGCSPPRMPPRSILPVAPSRRLVTVGRVGSLASRVSPPASLIRGSDIE